MTVPVENPSWVNHHARRVDFAGDYALGLDLYASLCKNYAIKAARNHHAIAFDLSFDLGVFAKDHGLLGDNIAFYFSVDAKRAGKLKRSLERHALIYKPRPFFCGAGVRRRETGPFPGHKAPWERPFYFIPAFAQVNVTPGPDCRMHPEQMGSADCCARLWAEDILLVKPQFIGFSQLNIQFTPNLSVSIANRAAQKVSWGGITTLIACSLMAAKIRSVSSGLSHATATQKLLPV